MIIGIGCDITNIERITKSADFLERFKNKILGTEELSELNNIGPITYKELACSLAKYYAGKEAFSKALGTGFRNGIYLKDIQIIHNNLGKPELKIAGEALNILQKMSPKYNLHITLSDDYPYAQAVVIIEK